MDYIYTGVHLTAVGCATEFRHHFYPQVHSFLTIARGPLSSIGILTSVCIACDSAGHGEHRQRQHLESPTGQKSTTSTGRQLSHVFFCFFFCRGFGSFEDKQFINISLHLIKCRFAG